MNAAMKAGIMIGILCGIWTLVMGITGWYKDPVLLAVFWVVIPIQIGVLIWGLRQTAAAGKTYGGQIAAGTLMSLVGGIILFFVSLLFTTVLFPNYFEELRMAQVEMLRAAGKTEAEISDLVTASASTQTPFMQALMGFLGTIVTGFVVSLILGIFIKRKEQPPAAA